jgi:hypothetical protein
MPANAVTVTANYETIPVINYTLTLSSNISGWGTVSGGGPFNAGTQVTAIATPTTGYRFVRWTEGGTSVSIQPSFTFVLNANRSLVAVFEAENEPPVEPPVGSNANLRTLSVSERTLSPAFSPNITNYTIESVPYEVTALTVSATAEHSAATITGTGIQNLDVGLNTIDVVVTAEDGTTKTYTVTVERLSNPNSNGVVNKKELKAWAAGGILHVEGLEAGKPWQVYNLSGVLIHQAIAGSGEERISLPGQGIYILVSGQNRVKFSGL